MPLTTVNPAMIGQTSTGAASLTATGSAAASLITAAGTAVSADSSGRVTMPFQPMFSAFSNNASPITTSITQRIMPYANIITNTGSFYSSNRFTAPVAGRYLFSFSALALGGGSGNLTLFKNGVSLGGTSSSARVITTGNESNLGQTVIAILAANDFVEVNYQNDGGTNQFFGAFGSFCGTLLG